MNPTIDQLRLDQGKEADYNLVIYATVKMNDTDDKVFSFNNKANPYVITFSDKKPDPFIMLAIVGVIVVVAAVALIIAIKKLSQSSTKF